MCKRRPSVHWAVAATLLVSATGCDQLLVTNVAAALRDGLVTLTSGLIEDTINIRFGLEPEREEEGGNDLFIGL